MATLKDQGQKGNYSALIAQTNSVMEVLYGQLNTASRLEFGSDMLLHDADSIVATTISHRLLKKFQEPDNKTAKRLHDACAQQWLAFEESLSDFSFERVSLRSKSVLYRARDLLADWTTSFKPDFTRTDFTPGETLFPRQGRVSMYQKLKTKECWTVTHDAFDDFARLVYHTRWLKKSAMAFMPRLTRSQYNRLYMAFRNESHVGYAVFKHRFENEVVTLVHGGRFETVYKDNTKRRPIIVAPLGNMLLQRCVAHPLRSILAGVGNDLEKGQDVHKIRISVPGNSTVDFSNASDSNLLKVIRAQFPRNVSRYLCRYRDPMVLIDGDYVLPHKLSSMGCGFTFEVMTLLLLSIARVLDPNATVYGDDVIIADHAAERFIEVMGELRWNVNEKKTFIGARFRESCGAFYLDGYGYITCFDFHWNENINDVIVTANKLLLICRGNPTIDTTYYAEAYEALLRAVPALLVGPVNTSLGPDVGFVMCDDRRRKHMRSEEARCLWKRLAPRVLEFAECYNWDIADITLATIPKFVSKQASKTPYETRNRHRIAHYLSAGRITQDSVRNEGRWVTNVYVVCSWGRVPISYLSEEIRKYESVVMRRYFLLYMQALCFHARYCTYLGSGNLNRALGG